MKNPPDVFIHDKALCESSSVGPGTRIWPFSHVCADVVIGADCNVCEHVFIESGVRIGDRVTIKCGVFLWDGVEIEDDVFIGPNATFTNDRFPRSKQHPSSYQKTTVEKGASVSANATILPGVRIGKNAMVGAGAVVTHDVPPNAIVMGVPAKINGYVDTPSFTKGGKPPISDATLEQPAIRTSRVKGVTYHTLPTMEDIRGQLTVLELAQETPFTATRMFLVHHVPSREVRGEHAHKACHQFLHCVSGSLHINVDDGSSRENFELKAPGQGLYIPPGVWGIQYKFSPDAMLAVLASHPYDPADYIRDYEEFLAYRRTLDVTSD